MGDRGPSTQVEVETVVRVPLGVRTPTGVTFDGAQTPEGATSKRKTLFLFLHVFCHHALPSAGFATHAKTRSGSSKASCPQYLAAGELQTIFQRGPKVLLKAHLHDNCKEVLQHTRFPHLL